jgi:putative component of toxin-antitoxin plasmid stabilization module
VEVEPQTIVDYTDNNGNAPIQEWLDDLEPVITARIRARLKRVAFGNFGDVKLVGQGVSGFC